MTQEEFERLISQDPALATPIRNAAAGIPSKSRTYGPAVDAAAALVVFHVVKFLLREIGLPWLYEAKRYTELWRQKFHNWIDKQYRKHNFDPDTAEAAGDALRLELEKITDAGAKKSWEDFAELLKREKQREENA